MSSSAFSATRVKHFDQHKIKRTADIHETNETTGRKKDNLSIEEWKSFLGGCMAVITEVVKCFCLILPFLGVQ